MLTHAVALSAEVVASSEGGEGGVSPYVVGGIALLILLALLFITTRFDRDR